jgi:hypothetical protein
VNAFAIFAVNEHLEFLLAEAAANRAVKKPGRSLRSRLAAAVASLNAGIEAQTDFIGTLLGPKPADYQYRG